jgi:hypothetical protein
MAFRSSEPADGRADAKNGHGHHDSGRDRGPASALGRYLVVCRFVYTHVLVTIYAYITGVVGRTLYRMQHR